MSRLALFIRQNHEDILAAWESFAHDLPPGAKMDVVALRDHARDMLDVIATDLESSQTEPERAKKSRGLSDAGNSAVDTAAEKHGFGRAESGFRVETMIAEFRALRASVISLWREREGTATDADLEEMTRFNEAIDQAVAESIAEFMRQVETTRDRFLAVLGHDLRNPLGAILMSSQFLLETGPLTESQRVLVSSIERSGKRMRDLVKDLLDLAVTRLGDGMPTKLAEMDLGVVVREVVAEIVAANRDRRIDVESSGSLVGVWDKARLAQALSNLVGNAVQHGSRTAPIKVALNGDKPDLVSVSISNQGPPIPPDEIDGIFEAMKGSPTGDRRHLGLGLYIVDKIVKAHEGSIEIQSSAEQGTTFTVALPRLARA